MNGGDGADDHFGGDETLLQHLLALCVQPMPLASCSKPTVLRMTLWKSGVRIGTYSPGRMRLGKRRSNNGVESEAD